MLNSVAFGPKIFVIMSKVSFSSLVIFPILHTMMNACGPGADSETHFIISSCNCSFVSEGSKSPGVSITVTDLSSALPISFLQVVVTKHELSLL